MKAVLALFLQLVPRLWVLGFTLWLQVLSLLGEPQPHTDVALALTTVLHDTAAYDLPAGGQLGRIPL